MLSCTQSFDSFPYQPEWKEGKACCKQGTQRQPNQVSIEQGQVQVLGNPKREDEQTKAEWYIKDRNDLSKTAHDAAVHFARILPGEIRPCNTKRQEHPCHAGQAHHYGDKTINKLQKRQPLHKGNHGQKYKSKTQSGQIRHEKF